MLHIASVLPNKIMPNYRKGIHLASVIKITIGLLIKNQEFIKVDCQCITYFFSSFSICSNLSINPLTSSVYCSYMFFMFLLIRFI